MLGAWRAWVVMLVVDGMGRRGCVRRGEVVLWIMLWREMVVGVGGWAGRRSVR
jgi:hypothetical protein